MTPASKPKSRAAVWMFAVAAAGIATVVTFGMRLGFERRTERLPWSVMPESYRALPVPRALAVVDEGCEMMHRGLARRYACRFETFGPPQPILDAFGNSLRAQGWQADGEDAYAREDWRLRMRYSKRAPGLSDVTVVLARHASNDD